MIDNIRDTLLPQLKEKEMGKYLKTGQAGSYDMLAEGFGERITTPTTYSMQQLLKHCAQANSLTLAEYCRALFESSMGSYEQPLLPCNREKDNDMMN